MGPNPYAEKVNEASKTQKLAGGVMKALVCAIGFAVGGFAGLAVGLLLGHEWFVVWFYAIGACLGVWLAVKIHCWLRPPHQTDDLDA